MPLHVPDASSQLELRIKRDNLPAGCFDIKTVVVKKGPQAYKTVTLRLFGNPVTKEVRKRELRVQQWAAKSNGPGFEFDEKENSWFCENDEIDAFAAFLNGEISESGVYRKIDSNSALVSVINHIESGDADPAQIRQLAEALAEAPDASRILAEHGPSQILLDGIQAARQKEVIARLTSVALNPKSLENDLQKILEGNWWIFGGRFIGKEKRRSLTVLDQLDIPLIRPDGALHVVELKLANVPDLVVKYRNHYIVGPKVNEAVGQAANYLRELDEQRHNIMGTLGIECRRAFSTVIIGHPVHVSGPSEEEISDAIRTYNSNLSRIEVITYSDLLAGASCALDLSVITP